MIYKKFLLLFIGILLSSTGFAQENSARKIMNFNDDWNFLKANHSDFTDILKSDATWESIRLPHDWSIKGEFDKDNPSGTGGGFLPCGTAWYKKTFTMDAELQNKKIFIRFDGVYMNSEVWINGNFLGLYPNGYSSFKYDLTPYIHFDKENVIAVRVNNSLQPSSRWYTGSGIYRNIWLIATDKTHFIREETFVTYQNVSRESADVHLKHVVKTDAFPETDFHWWRKNPAANTRITKPITVKSTIFDSSGKKVGEESTLHQLQDFSQITIKQKISVKNPNLWSASNPHLYRLHVSVSLDGTVVDDLSMNIGIRSIEYHVDKGMLVNGIPEKLKGVCLHQDAGSLGVAVPAEMWRYRLNTLKEMGCNAIRPSHHPFAPEFYDLCDEMGFYVMDEAFDEWRHGNEWGRTVDNSGKVQYGYHRYFDQWAKTDLRNMILNARNRPSVVMYSIGNEIPDQRKEDGVKTAKWLVDICHELDSTRLVTAGVDFIADANQNGFLDVLDIAGYNYLGRFTDTKMYGPEREKYPNRLFVGTETYHDTYYWLAVRDNPYVIGEFVWSGYDYLGEASRWPKRGWDAGIIDIAEYRRPEYYLRKAYWTDDPVVHIAVENYPNKDITQWHPRNVATHWNWKWKDGYLSDVYVYTNCDSVALYLNNNLLEVKEVHKDEYLALFKVQYQPGELKAIGYRGGEKVGEHIVRTAGNPVDFDVRLSKNAITPDYNDVVIVFIELKDKNNTTVPDNDHQFKVEVSGSGKLLGLESGNMYSHEPYHLNVRRTHNGRMIAIIGYDEGNGNDIKVKITDVNNAISKEKQIRVTERRNK